MPTPAPVFAQATSIVLVDDQLDVAIPNDPLCFTRIYFVPPPTSDVVSVILLVVEVVLYTVVLKSETLAT